MYQNTPGPKPHSKYLTNQGPWTDEWSGSHPVSRAENSPCALDPAVLCVSQFVVIALFSTGGHLSIDGLYSKFLHSLGLLCAPISLGICVDARRSHCATQSTHRIYCQHLTDTKDTRKTFHVCAAVCESSVGSMYWATDTLHLQELLCWGLSRSMCFSIQQPHSLHVLYMVCWATVVPKWFHFAIITPLTGGKKFHKLTSCSGSIPSQHHTWIRWALWNDAFFHKWL